MAGMMKLLKGMVKLGLLSVFSFYSLSFPIGAQINLLHEFEHAPIDGALPEGSLLLDGAILYGMTSCGGSSNSGTIFKIGANGTGYSILHEFSQFVSDGVNPDGSLILFGSTLYGMTPLGGENGKGVIFKLETDGSGYTLLHTFSGGINDGQGPGKSLILSDSVLYGMCSYGGDSDKGVIFKINADGSEFALLHEFTGNADDGASPEGALLLSGSTLYGMTHNGGDADKGTIFKMETDGSGFSLLHEFAGYPDDGDRPLGSLIISGSTLFGMTEKGGINEGGTLFKVQGDGSGFSLLHSFDNTSASDGCFPSEDLVLSGSVLIGMTPLGGSQSYGTIFQIKTDGTGFSLLYEFSEENDVGHYPYGSLTISGSELFGMTRSGGGANAGAIFSLPKPELTLTSPNGGESWPKGSSQQVTWKSPGISGNARLVLYRDGVKTGVIATVPAAQGSYDWAAGAYIGGSAPAAKNYKIKIVTTDGAYNDWSDANFALTLEPYLRLATPNGGESWPLGGTRQIAWDARGLTGNVRLVLYSGNSKVGAIATLPAASGAHEWTVGEYIGGTAPAGSNYRIRIVALDAALSDFSDGSFAITTD